MVYKDKLWIKFNENLDIECFCPYNSRRCLKDKKDCHVYLAKFIRMENAEKHDERMKALSDANKRLEERLKQKTTDSL